MRKFKKLLTALLSASMALSFSTVSAWAEDYTYTVTFYAGNQGTFGNQPQDGFPQLGRILHQDSLHLVAGQGLDGPVQLGAIRHVASPPLRCLAGKFPALCFFFPFPAEISLPSVVY